MTPISISIDPPVLEEVAPNVPCVVSALGINQESSRELRLLQEYQAAVDQTNSVIIISQNATLSYVNDEYCRISKYERGEVIGKVLNTLPYFESDGIIADYILHVPEPNKRPFSGLLKMINATGEIYWLKTRIVPVFDETANLIEYIFIGNDVTKNHLLEEELRKSFVKFQELDEKKDEFINIASHEFRTPMTAISGYISMILDGDAGEISPESRKYLEQVFKSSKELLTLINDMLDIAKLESGKWKLFYEDIEMKGFIGDTIANLRPLALLKKQNIEILIDYDELIYRTDNRKFQQVLINIVGNALKYTPEQGYIKVHSWITDESLFVEVADTGIGIPKTHLTHIFEKFAQVKNPLTRDINGTGLGLAITKKIIEKFFGTIKVESEEWQGSVFTIELPLQRD